MKRLFRVFRRRKKIPRREAAAAKRRQENQQRHDRPNRNIPKTWRRLAVLLRVRALLEALYASVDDDLATLALANRLRQRLTRGARPAPAATRRALLELGALPIFVIIARNHAELARAAGGGSGAEATTDSGAGTTTDGSSSGGGGGGTISTIYGPTPAALGSFTAAPPPTGGGRGAAPGTPPRRAAPLDALVAAVVPPHRVRALQRLLLPLFLLLHCGLLPARLV